MHIGLIGGIGPAATFAYHKMLIDRFAVVEKQLKLTIAHADAPTLLENLSNDNAAQQADLYVPLTETLKNAGADIVAITSIAGHFCIDEFLPISPLPVINMIDSVSTFVRDKGMARLGLLGTKKVMETTFYEQLGGLDVIVPEGTALNSVHDAYSEMAAAGVANDDHRRVFETACADFNNRGASAILLGGTDYSLLKNQYEGDLPLIDCIEVHVSALLALS